MVRGGSIKVFAAEVYKKNKLLAILCILFPVVLIISTFSLVPKNYAVLAGIIDLLFIAIFMGFVSYKIGYY